MLKLRGTGSSPLTHALSGPQASCWPEICPGDSPAQRPHSATWLGKDTRSRAGRMSSHPEPPPSHRHTHSGLWLLRDPSCLDLIILPTLCQSITMSAGSASVIQLTQRTLEGKEAWGRAVRPFCFIPICLTYTFSASESCASSFSPNARPRQAVGGTRRLDCEPP